MGATWRIRLWSNNYSSRFESAFRMDAAECTLELRMRLSQPAPGRIQLLSGRRQVGKTTLLVELADELGPKAIYWSGDESGSTAPGAFGRAFADVEAASSVGGTAVLLLDEITSLPSWAAHLKGAWDRLRRRKLRVHIVATGSSSVVLGEGVEESLAGRFERLELTHWTPTALAKNFRMSAERACETTLRSGTYPGAVEYSNAPERWAAYIRDAVIEPALSRDIRDIGRVRRPALLRQVFHVATSSPAQIVALEKMQGRLDESGSLETIASYLGLLERAYHVAHLDKFSTRAARQRAAPPKLVTLNHALLAVADPLGAPTANTDPERFGRWLENAVLAHAWNRGQRVRYWREEPHEVDAVLDGSRGSFAIEVKSGRYSKADLTGLFEFTRRHPRYRVLVVGVAGNLIVAERLGLPVMRWQDFLLRGPARISDTRDLVSEIAPTDRATKKPQKKPASGPRTPRSPARLRSRVHPARPRAR